MEFIKLYEDEFGEKLPIDEAREITSRLVELYTMLAEPLPSELKEKEATLLSGESVSESVPAHTPSSVQ